MKNLKLLFSKVLLVMLLPTALTGQVTWVPQVSGTSVKLHAVQFLDANNGYACGDNGTVIKTTDGGTTWTPANINTTIPVCDIYFVSTSEGWAAVGDENNSSSSGQIWHTTNGGTSWSQQTPSSTEARFGVSFASSAVGWQVGSKNGPINIDATTNGGATAWMNQSDSNIFGWLYKIDALSTSTAFSIGGAFFPSVTGFIIKTTNGGSSWSQLNTGTIPFMNGIDMVNTSNGFVVGDAGFIMTTVNGGTNWTTQTSGTTDTLQDVSFVSTSVGLTCGFAGTIRRTINGGNNWTGETSGTTQNLNGIYALDTTTAWAVGDSGKVIKRTLAITGIQEQEKSYNNVYVFPNPFSDHTTISFENPLNNKSSSLIICDMTGKIVKTIAGISGSQIVLPKEFLAPGIYNFSLQSDTLKTIIGTGKLIIH